MEKKYVYRHRTTTDGRVFYVGCGSKKRCFETTNSRRSKEWLDVYNNEGLIVEILFETTDEDEALEIERQYINKYGRTIDGGSLVNKATFKCNGGVKCSEETKRKLSESKSGEKHYLFGKPSPKRKTVLQYSKSGDFIREWVSACDAAKELNLYQQHICNACNGKLKSTGGFIWKYKKEEI